MVSLADLQRRIELGELSADAAIAQSLEAIAAQDKTIGAFVCHRIAAHAPSAGPLRGRPSRAPGGGPGGELGTVEWSNGPQTTAFPPTAPSRGRNGRRCAKTPR